MESRLTYTSTLFASGILRFVPAQIRERGEGVIKSVAKAAKVIPILLLFLLKFPQLQKHPISLAKVFIFAAAADVKLSPSSLLPLPPKSIWKPLIALVLKNVFKLIASSKNTSAITRRVYAASREFWNLKLGDKSVGSCWKPRMEGNGATLEYKGDFIVSSFCRNLMCRRRGLKILSNGNLSSRWKQYFFNRPTAGSAING